jgi:hypothetical protein
MNSAGLYKLPVIAKEQENNLFFVEEFLKKYDRYYIHNKKSYVATGKGLGEVLSEPINTIKSSNFTDILVRGYTHDFRIIIFILLSFGFTLWLNSNPLQIPQIELCREIVQQPYVYIITHSILSSSQHMRIEPTKCILKKIPSFLTPSTDFDFDTSTTTVKYIKHHYYPGWSELKHIQPEELGKSILLNEKVISLLGSLTLVFDPLDILQKCAEDVGKSLEDFNDTAQGRMAKRGKCKFISMVIVILLMSLVESPPVSIPC